MRGLDCREIGPADDPWVWEFLDGREDALIYYTPKYRSFLLDLLGCGCGYIGAWQDGSLTGLLPIMERRGPFGTVLNSLPYYGSHGGALASSENVAKQLGVVFDELASASGVIGATWIEHPFKTHSPQITYQFKDARIGQMTCLKGIETEVDLFGRVDPAARRNVRKAHKMGVRVEVDDTAWSFLRETHQANMKAIGGQAKSSAFFHCVPKHFEAGKDYELWTARRDGRLVAAILLLYFGTTVEYFVPVTVHDERENQPTALIIAAAMVDLSRRGYTRWNWGGTWHSQGGVYRFKRKWGAQQGAYRYFIRLREEAVLTHSAAEILTAYPGFYVVPFSQLRNAV